MSKKEYFDIFKIFTKCHNRKKLDGTIVRWLDENLDPYTGEWISRSILESRGWRHEKGGRERGRDYNHSTYCDLIISGLVGLRPREDDILEINPLVPGGWNYFCLDNVNYHGRRLTIMFDRDGSRYGKGEGLQVLVYGKPAGITRKLSKLKLNL